MFDPFAYSGPKSAARLEDERYVLALDRRDQKIPLNRIAEEIGIKYETLRWRLHMIDKEMA